MALGMMRRGFVATRSGIQLRLDGDEGQILAQLLDQLAHLVDDGDTESVPAPSGDPLADLLAAPDDDERPRDPAVLRLFPDGYRDDTEAADEFRRYTQSGLRQLKSERLATTRRVVARVPAEATRPESVPVSPDEADAFLTTLNDLRLVLGVRLEIVADEQDVAAEWSPGDPRRATYGAYQWLTWLQAGLLDALPPVSGKER